MTEPTDTVALAICTNLAVNCGLGRFLFTDNGSPSANKHPVAEPRTYN